MATELTITGPQPGPQTMLALCRADVAICGGSFFGGKSVSILMDAGRNIDHSRYRGNVFRRTYSQITDSGGLADIAAILYPPYGGKSTSDGCVWRFPSGAKIQFRHLQHEGDVVQLYQSSQFSFLGIDQVEGFSQFPVFYLISRTRNSPGYNRRPYVRMSCNPEPGWLARLLKWWWNPLTGYPIKERAGVTRHYTQIGGEIVWVDENWRSPTGDKPMSLTFIPSTMYDNVAGMKNDPSYISKVQSLDPVAVERYLKGNWLVSYSGGVFDASWFKKVEYEDLPKDLKLLRYWDFAASEVKEGKDPDWTSGALCGTSNGDFYIVNVKVFRDNPGVTIKTVSDTAHEDGSEVPIRWEEEKGSAGKFNTAHLSDKLLGYNAKGDPVQGDKVERAKPLADAAYKGRVFYVEGDWNIKFLEEIGSFPNKTRDIVDSIDGAMKCLCTEKRVFPNFSISGCSAFSIDWKKSYKTNIVYGSFFQSNNGSIQFVAATYDPKEDFIAVYRTETYESFELERIAFDIIKILKMRSLQNIKIVCNLEFGADNPVKRSPNSILGEYLKANRVKFNSGIPIAYDEKGSIAYMNTMLLHDSLLIHKALLPMISQAASWAYSGDKTEDGHGLCRALLHIISDVRIQKQQKEILVPVKEYQPKTKPIQKGVDSWQTI